MIFLLLSIACSVTIAHIFKYAAEKQIPMFALFAVNYGIGSVVAFSACETWRVWELISPNLLLLGVTQGVLFVGSYVLMAQAIKRLGVIIPVSLMRLSAVIPTFASILFFAEIPQPLQIAGIIIVFISLSFATQERLLLTNWSKIFHNGLAWGLMLFVVYGITNFGFKIQREFFLVSNPAHFLVIVFPTAFLVSLTMVFRQKLSIYRDVLRLGSVLGVINLFASYFFMRALQVFPGIVVYPINGIGIILASTITSIFFWKERLTRANYIFIALALSALLMIYPH